MFLIIAFIVVIVYAFVHDTVKKSKERIEQAKKTYQDILNQLAQDPKNTTLRTKALGAGRY